MARTVEEIEDRTPLAGSRIDLGARIGWLLRTWRVARGVPLRTLSQRLPAGDRFASGTLSRLETAGVRNGRVIAAYERALDLPYGNLRTPVDVLCRTFSYAPIDQAPFAPEASLEAFTAACSQVEACPDGQDWLRFAEQHALGSFGLPAGLARPHVRRLASELGRTVGMSYQLRYDALAKLRCSAYGDLVLDVVREAVERPGAQRLNDLMSAVSERPDGELLAWCGELLAAAPARVAYAACLAIQNMRSVGGPLTAEHWAALAPSYATACDRFHGHASVGPILASTLAACPPQFRTRVRELITTELAPVRRPRSWRVDDAHFAFADELAHRVRRGRPGQRLLARLLFEVLYDFRATHVVTSAFLLAASVFAEDVQQALAVTALEGPDEVTRHGAAHAFASLMLPNALSAPERWLSSPDPVIQSAGLVVAGHAGVKIDENLLRSFFAADAPLRTNALFAAGMAGHPYLASLANDPTADPALREGAAWWVAEGTRIVD